jgi:organic radical activating enzyme
VKTHERRRGIYRAPQIAARLLLDGRYDFVYDQMPISMLGMSWPKRLNLARSGLNLLYRRLQPWSMPLHMQFELINYCDLRCPVCPTGNRDISRPPRMMDFPLFRSVMEKVGPFLLTASLWGWGESLLHPNLADFLREAQRHKIAVLLSTNGQHLDRNEVIEAIMQHPPTFLIVAIDGLTDETNSRFRVGARLAPVLEGMRRLVEIKKRMRGQLPVFQMRFIPMKHNQHELPQALGTIRRGGDFGATYQALWKHFADCIRLDAQPGCTLADGRKALQIALATVASSQTRVPISLTP